ncbi:efflux RND transporter periplasmic adaptor subunit [Isosphaeraceae bacterium EP7]
MGPTMLDPDLTTARPYGRPLTKVAAMFAPMLAVSLLAAGCGQGNVYHEPPPPEVIVAKPVLRGVTSYLEYTGTAQPTSKVELRARVKGFLKERLFQDGADVKAGEVLFVIDEEPFKVGLEQAKAKLAEAEAGLAKAERSKGREIAKAQHELDNSQLSLSKLEEARTRALVARNSASREDLDRAEATRKKSEAQMDADLAAIEQSTADYEINILSARSSLEGARAAVRNAELDLSYCRISSPIDGRINNRDFDVGNYVGEGTATTLATVVKIDPVYAYVSVSEDDMLRVQDMIRAGKQRDYREATLTMELGLGNEDGYPHKGKVDYIDPMVDTGTGTRRTRGLFTNTEGIITPGQFVRVRMPFESRQNALMVPERALGSDQQGAYLLAVGKEDKVERRQVKLGIEDGGLREVTGKIGADDRIVVDGLLRARPGLKVSPKLDQEAAAAVARHEDAGDAPAARPN